MADYYKSLYSGAQIDASLGRIINGDLDAAVNAASASALASASSAQSAADSAAGAVDSEAAAVVAAGVAEDKAAEANGNAVSALASKNSASSSATSAATSATTAANKAILAETAASTATTEANRAKAEADRAAAIDAYSKPYINRHFSRALKGSATGESINVPGVQAESLLSKLVISGNTVQAGTPTPEAPVPLQSVVSPVGLRLTGKNLFDKSNIINKGFASNGAQTVLMANPNTRAYVVRCRPNTKYSAKRVTASSNRFAIGFIDTYPVSEVNLYNIFPASFSQQATNIDLVVSSTSLHTSKYVVLYLSNASEGIPDVMLCEGDIAPYEPYSGATHTIPLIATDGSTIELAKLPNGVADTVELGSNGRWKVVRRVGQKVFDGTEIMGNSNWRPGGDTFGVFYPYSMTNNITQATNTVANIYCTHLQARSYGSLYDYFSDGIGVYSNTQVGLVIRVPLTIASDAIGLKAYFAAQYAAGTPVTVLYERATPVIIDLSDATQTALNALYNAAMPTTLNMWTDNAVHPSITIEYSKDINVAFAQMQAAILALGGT